MGKPHDTRAVGRERDPSGHSPVGAWTSRTGCPSGPGGDRVVAAVGGLVDGDDVGAVGQVVPSEDGEMTVLFGEHGDGAAFGGHVEPGVAWVVGDDIGGVADLLRVAGLVGVQVQGCLL